MGTVLARVDNRLVHGQILETWVDHTSANSIVIFNDDVFNNQLQKDIIRAFVPSYIDVVIKKISDIPTSLEYVNEDTNRCIVLFFNIHDAFVAYKNGFLYTKLNLGNIHCQPKSRQITQNIYLVEEDIQELMLLERMGINIEIKAVPREKGTNFDEVLKSDK